MKAWQSGELSSPLPANAEDVLRDWGGPTCLIHGAHDMRFPVEHARRLHRAVPRIHLAVIDDAGHMAHFEQPVRWADQLHRFLQ